MPIYRSKFFKESALAHQYLDRLRGLEIGGSIHNAFGLDTLNVDYSSDMGTDFKREELTLTKSKNGEPEAMPVDIVANGDNIPVPDKSYDFVISSHVIEHFFDPIKAIKEWCRIATSYVFIICPQPTALESDKTKPITPLQEICDRHSGLISPPEIDLHEHYTRWTSKSFLAMCDYLGLNVVTWQDPDDKVGNGFTIVIGLEKAKNVKLGRTILSFSWTKSQL
jgi:SAM-dependent methyltransferase